MNLIYERYWGGFNKMYFERLGKKYIEINKFCEIIDGGLILCGGFDSDVCDYNFFVGIYLVVNYFVKKYRISLYEVIRIYIINGVYVIFEENNKGSLEIGKLVDIIILDIDIFEIDKESIDKIKVLCIIKFGKIFYNVI